MGQDTSAKQSDVNQAGRDIILSGDVCTTHHGDMSKEAALWMTSAIIFSILSSFIIFFSIISAQHEKAHMEIVYEIQDIKKTMAANVLLFTSTKESQDQINRLSQENDKLISLIKDR